MIKLSRALLFLLLFIGGLNVSKAQKIHRLFQVEDDTKRDFRYFFFKTPWIVQLGWAVIDDDGKPYRDFFDAKKSWNVAPYPNKFALEKQLKYGLTLESSLTINLYKSGKIINNDVISSSGNFFCVDLNGKYDLNRIIGNTQWFDPYFSLGFGYTNRVISAFTKTYTGNTGLGFNLWFYQNEFGINFQTQAKFGFHKPFIKTETNYMHHSIGGIYKFTWNNRPYLLARRHLRGIIKKRAKF